ncbi:serine/threonine protein phosphatase [Trypanosoma grayi]|uniref:serine/threonine protein phosphatase n=1 Tax=Trypanosoma grayi TaxID=71804 RepID=UPI0004F43732|nr:serine/threonine protein phosphatase [Trypanosoma grayi]KEG12030.1 serine/threonine protein phosphatase [Trypanosoma grayi]
MKGSVGLLALLIFGSLLSICHGESQAGTLRDNVVPNEIHRIVVIGDVHGDAHHFRQILTMAGLVSQPTKESKHVAWKPKWDDREIELHSLHHTRLRTTLIQLGDLVDRGEEDLEVLEIASSLSDQVDANHTNDNMVLLLGNHELLNLQGQFYYVHPESMGGFLTKTLRKRAFELNGIFGRFLLDRFEVLHLDADTVFVHAGLNEMFALMGVEALNKEAKQAIREGNHRHPILGSSGPLWTRQMIMEASNGHCENIKKMLLAIGAERIVVGHTPQRSGHVETFCDDSVIAADVGLSRWMYGNLAALEIMVTSYKTGTNVWKDVVLREIVTSDIRRNQTLDESLNDSLVLEELQHAVEEFRSSQVNDASGDILGDL